MAKKQFNFRIDEKLLERIREHAEMRELSVTEWLEDACFIALGISDEDRDAAYRIESKRDRDRLIQIENALKTLQKQMDDHVQRLDDRIDSLWDSMDYVADDLEASKKTREELVREFMRAVMEDMQRRDRQGLPPKNYDLKSFLEHYLD